MNKETMCIGVDVSKSELVIAYFDEQRSVVSIANEAKAIQAWLCTLPACCRIGVEATGTYHCLLADLAVAAGHRVYVLNPRALAHYLKSLKGRGKTDLLDARGIARFVHNETDNLHPYVPPSALQRELATLLHRRHQLIKQRSSVQMSFKGLALCSASMQKLIEAFDGFIADIDAQLKARIAADAALEAARARLDSISGVGALISCALTLRLSRVPYLNSDALVAALGLDPRPRDSGQMIGRRYLSKQGNPEERRLIYLAAVSACRTALWRPLVEKLRQRGFSTVAVHCIVARKLLRIALALWNSGKNFNPALVKALA